LLREIKETQKNDVISWVENGKLYYEYIVPPNYLLDFPGFCVEAIEMLTPQCMKGLEFRKS
jgi:hypothetical protein